MAQIYIEPSKGRSVVEDEAQLFKTLAQLTGEVSRLRGNLRYQIAGRQQISDRLFQVMDQMAKEAALVKKMETGLEQIIKLYEQTENANLERLVAEKTPVQVGVTGGNTTEKTSDTSSEWWNILKKILKSALGPYGLITQYPDLVDDDANGSDLIKFLLDGVGSFAKIISTKGETTAKWWSSLFGVSGKEITSASKYFLDKIGKFDTLANTVGTIANWGTNFVDSLVENNDEFAGEWCTRFWEETIVETGIKIVKGAVFSTAAAGIVSLVCATAAPSVLAVGLTAAALSFAFDWGLNEIVTWIPGENYTKWTEVVSDVICDGLDYVQDKIGTAVTKTKEKIGNYAERLFGGCRWQGCLAM